MRRVKLVLIMMIIATLACLGSGGEDTEAPETDTTLVEATSTKVMGSLQKPTATPTTEPQEEPTSTPEATETPKPTEAVEEPIEGEIIISSNGIEYIEIFYPVQYFVENDANLEIVSMWFFRDEFGGVDIYGLMKNNEAVNMGFIEIYIGAIDSSDEVLDAVYAHIPGNILFPEEIFPFSASWFDGIPEDTEEIVVVIEALADPLGYLDVHNYEILSSDVRRLTDGKHLVAVRIRNNSEYTTNYVYAHFIFYDAYGRIIGEGWGGPEEMEAEIPPGGEAEFDFQVYEMIGEYERFEIITYGSVVEE